MLALTILVDAFSDCGLMLRLQSRAGLGPLTRSDIAYQRIAAPEPSSNDVMSFT